MDGLSSSTATETLTSEWVQRRAYDKAHSPPCQLALTSTLSSLMAARETQQLPKYPRLLPLHHAGRSNGGKQSHSNINVVLCYTWCHFPLTSSPLLFIIMLQVKEGPVTTNWEKKHAQKERIVSFKTAEFSRLSIRKIWYFGVQHTLTACSWKRWNLHILLGGEL